MSCGTLFRSLGVSLVVQCGRLKLVSRLNFHQRRHPYLLFFPERLKNAGRKPLTILSAAYVSTCKYSLENWVKNSSHIKTSRTSEVYHYCSCAAKRTFQKGVRRMSNPQWGVYCSWQSTQNPMGISRPRFQMERARDRLSSGTKPDEYKR